MNRSQPYAVTKYDRRKSLERQNSVKESLDALGIGLDDDDDSVMRCIKLNPPLLEKSCRTICRETDNVQGQKSSIIANKDKKRKCPPRRVVSVDTAVDFSTQTSSSHSNKKEDSNTDHGKKSPGQKRVSRKPKQKSQELEGDSSTKNQATSATTKLPRQKEEASRTKAKTKGTQSRQKRPPRKPKKKSQGLSMMDEDASIMSVATDTSESINDSSFGLGPNNDNHGIKLLGVKKRSSFLVPTISPQVPIGLNDSMRIDDLYYLLLPDDAESNTTNTNSGRSSVTFSDFSQMSIVADYLSDDNNDDLFYNDKELAEFRHEAFLQSCGLGEDEFMSL